MDGSSLVFIVVPIVIPLVLATGSAALHRGQRHRPGVLICPATGPDTAALADFLKQVSPRGPASPAGAPLTGDRGHARLRRDRVSAHRADAPQHAAKHTIVLVHGAWADASSWDGVASILLRDGYTVDVALNPLRGLTYDTGYLQDYLADITGPIVLVGHSYGGAVITDAATGNANVKALVYDELINSWEQARPAAGCARFLRNVIPPHGRLTRNPHRTREKEARRRR